MPALPGFEKLVEAVYEELGETLPEDLQGKHDEALGRLELRRQSRAKVRKIVRERLTLKPDEDLPTHRALLKLAATKGGQLRLVTTNFDRAFLQCSNSPPPFHVAPFLPIPKPETWNGVVHLHGRLEYTDPDCENLILSSSDFGRAYLTERWASRFLSELFRQFSVLFVGYSADDPVMRYTLDALAADRQLAESHERETPCGEAYILTPIEGTTQETIERWRDRNVIAVPYDKSPGDHHLLRDTLIDWAEAHSNGTQGRCEIIAKHAGTVLDPLSRGQVLWAIRDPTAAKQFAKQDPLPPIGWLDEFETPTFFAVKNMAQPSFFSSASVELGESPMALVWWLGRHAKAGTPELIDRVLNSGSNLHPSVRGALLQELNHGNLPKPCDQIWRAIIHYGPLQHAFQSWVSVGKAEWNIATKLALLRCLEPIPLLEPTFSREFVPSKEHLEHYVSVKVTVRARDMAFHLLTELEERPDRVSIYRELLDPMTTLLDRAMEIEELFDLANADRDSSHWQRPSISVSSQNNDYYALVVLIELVRRGWDAISADSAGARSIVSRWRLMRYPVFRRLILHALTISEFHSRGETLDMLLDRDWLWHESTRREVFQLLLAIWPQLDVPQSLRLLERIADGKPEGLKPEGANDERWSEHCDREKWLRLNALNGLKTLEGAAAAKFNGLAVQYGWNGPHNEKSEYTNWMGPTTSLPYDWAEPRDPAYSELTNDEIKAAASVEPDAERLVRLWRPLFQDRRDDALAIFFECPPFRQRWKCWHDVLIVRQDATIDAARWITALAEDSAAMSPESTSELAHIVSQSLADLAKAVPAELQDSFWCVWDKFYMPAFTETVSEGDIHSQALNSGAGYLAQAYLRWLGTGGMNALSELETRAMDRLNDLATGTLSGHHHSKYFLVQNLNWVFNLDADWATANLIPLLALESPGRIDFWKGFVSSLRMTKELWLIIKSVFVALNLPELFAEDIESESMALIMLTWARLYHPETLEIHDIKERLRKSRSKARVNLLSQLESSLYRDESPSKDAWDSRVKPFIQKCWPGGPDFRNAEEASGFAKLAIAAGIHFPDALTVVDAYLTKINPHTSLAYMLQHTGRATQHPAESLALLAKIMQDQDDLLGALLEEIRTASPSLASDPRFVKLQNLPTLP